MTMEKNIKLAIQQVAKYIEIKINQSNPRVNIYDFLAVAGYDNIEEYFKDKTDYLIKSQHYEIVEQPTIDASQLLSYSNNGISTFSYVIECDKNFAFVTDDFDRDDVLIKHNYEVIRFGYNDSNGPILSKSGDFRAYLSIADNVDIDITYFLCKACAFISEYYDNVYVDNNDIMIGDTKICGCAQLKHNHMNLFMFQFTFNDITEELNELGIISKKKVGHIDTNILSPQKLKDEFISWLTL